MTLTISDNHHSDEHQPPPLVRRPTGELRHIHKFRIWKLPEVLHEKYLYTRAEANEVASFLVPMLAVEPRARASAYDMLQHSWLRDLD